MALWHWLLTFHLGRAEWPLPAEQHELHGVQTFVHWPGRVEAVLLLFHGCNNQGSDWFQKPEEVIFLREATSRANAVIAFTTPRHRGNFCWPNADGDSDDFETSVTMIYRATAALLQMKAKPNGKKPTLVLVGASSGGVFASHLPNKWQDSQDVWKISAFLSVVSPTSFVRKGELLQAPGETFPRTGLAYMPKDVSFASEEATTTLLGSLQNLGVAAKAWAVHPRRLTPADFADRFRSAGLVIQDHAVERFIEALSDLGLVDGGEVLDDPRRFPWQRAISLLKETRPPSLESFDFDARRSS
ncbi:unnamed protein product [Effrenium voratum]|nr:unnamed protein product [Effrenium voratum]